MNIYLRCVCSQYYIFKYNDFFGSLKESRVVILDTIQEKWWPTTGGGLFIQAPLLASKQWLHMTDAEIWGIKVGESERTLEKSGEGQRAYTRYRWRWSERYNTHEREREVHMGISFDGISVQSVTIQYVPSPSA